MTTSKAVLHGAGMLMGAGVLWAANAADVYHKGDSLKDEPVYMSPITWAGFYVGLHAGGTWGSNDVTDVDNYNEENFSFDDNAFIGGAQIGYNVQRGSAVFGIEGEFGYLGFDNSKQAPSRVGLPGDSVASFQGDLYGTLTGRLGIASDRFLIYAKGGVAFLSADASFIDTNPAGDLLVSGTKNSDTLTGWVVGGGVEYALSNNWSLKAEYLHFDFSDLTVRAIDDTEVPRDFRNDATVDTVKVGINYKFGSDRQALK